MSRLRAVFFDIDDTLCATTEFALRARRNAVRAMISAGLAADEDLVWNELVEVIAEFSSNYEHHYDKLLLRLPPEAVSHVNRALVVAAGVAAYHDTKFRELVPYAGVPELLRDLRAQGLCVGIVSHGLTLKQAEKLVRLRLVPYLDPEAIFISDQIGIAKPNPKLYQTALRARGLVPAEAAYVGDNVRNDIAPPKSLGMVTFLARMRRPSLSEPSDASHTPDHVFTTYGELRSLLERHYGLRS